METQNNFESRNEINRFLNAFEQNPTLPDLRGSLYSTIDHLKFSSTSSDIIETANAISLIVLKLGWSLQKGDQDGVSKYRQELSDLKNAWAVSEELTLTHVAESSEICADDGEDDQPHLEFFPQPITHSSH